MDFQKFLSSQQRKRQTGIVGESSMIPNFKYCHLRNSFSFGYESDYYFRCWTVNTDNIDIM